MAVKRITFQGHDGSELSARLDMPSGPHLATAVFAHCFTCGKDIPAARRIAARLAAMGIAVLRFDFTGLGHSEGEFENTSFSSNVDDLIAATTWAAQNGMPPSLLIGHSLGGAAVIKAAGILDGIKAVATIGAPFDPAHVTHHFADALPEIARNGSAEVTLGGRPFRIGKSFIEDTGNGLLSDVLGALKAALLILHAPRDTVVSVDSAAQIFMAAKHPKSFVSLDDADHLVTNPKDAEFAADVIATWAARYIDRPLPAPPYRHTRRRRTGVRGKCGRILARHHFRQPLAYARR
jgi:alpha-beta hydrolase superfamily lysophospholipase